MKISFTTLAATGCYLVLSLAYGENVPDNQARQKLERAGQMVVVTTTGWTNTEAVLQRYERTGESGWNKVGEPVSVVVGKNGLAWSSDTPRPAAQGQDTKKEGDGKAPAGVFALGSAFGYAGADDPDVRNLKIPYIQASEGLVCVDDPDSVYYNQLVDSSSMSRTQWKSAEKMLRKDHLYSWGLVVEHNTGSPVPGSGSCIFLHVWRSPGRPTVGCTALDKEKLKEVLGWLDKNKKPVLVQLPIEEYSRRQKEWQLP